MKKNSLQYDDEIDLIALFKIIWHGKIKILLITIISFLVGFGYNYQIPRNYLNSLNISTSKASEFIKIDNIRNLINLDQSRQSSQSNVSSQSSGQLYLDKFINELKDNEEFLLSIKNTKKIREHFSKLKIEYQEVELFKYEKLLEIVELKKDKEYYIINFKWHDPDEAKKILQDTLNLTSLNVKNSIHLELSQFLELEKKLVLKKDREKLNFLKEQLAIADELNITRNLIDYVNIFQVGVPLNLAYYLRGSAAINKEIELIQNRDNPNIKLLEQEINFLKKENIKWVNYNIHLMNSELLKNTKSILVISILLGLIVGIFYVLISNTFQSKKTSK